MRAQRPALALRYAIHLPLDLGDVVPRFVGTDMTTGQTVVIAFFDSEMAALLTPGIGCLHRHLAGLVDTVPAPNLDALPKTEEKVPSGVAIVAELIRGKTLAEAMQAQPLGVDRAVAWTIRILEGLIPLHQRQVPHGAISSHAIVAEPKGRPIAPVVSQLVAPPLHAYASPERLAGSGPSLADDLWAIGLLLFEMLIGRLPSSPATGGAGRREISESDAHALRALTHGRELEVILRRMLSADRARRPSSVEELLDILDRWEQRIALPVTVGRNTQRATPLAHAGTLAPWDRLIGEFEGGGKRLHATLDAAEQMRLSVLSDRSPQPTEPPRSNRGGTSPSRKPAARSTRPADGTERRRMPSFGPEMAAFRERSRPKLGKWLIASLGLCGILVTGLYLFATREESAAVASVASGLPTLSSVATVTNQAPPRPKLSVREERSQCIRSYFRPDTVNDGIDLGFVCTEEDFLVVNRRLNNEALLATPLQGVAGASGLNNPDGGVEKRPIPTNPTMIVRSEGASPKGWQLGWYELVATAIIRQSCCREAAPIKLPESTGWCQQLQTVVRRIAADSNKVGDISPGVRSFDEAIQCLLAQGRHGGYPYKTLPTTLNKAAFQQFLKHAAEVDARRTARR